MDVKVEIKKVDKTWFAESVTAEFKLMLSGFRSRQELMSELLKHLINNSEVYSIELKWARQKMFPSIDYVITSIIKLTNSKINHAKVFKSVTTIHSAGKNQRIIRDRTRELGDNAYQLANIIDNEALCIIGELP